MIDEQETELVFWQARCDDMQVALETVRAHREELQNEGNLLKEQLKTYKSMVDRMRIAMSQGLEL